MRRLLVAALLAGVVASLGADTTWPQFRGRNAGAVPDNPSLPDEWSTTMNVAWQTSIPGSGWGSPVVWNDHVFVTSVVTSVDQPPKLEREYAGGVKSPIPPVPHRWTVYDVDFKTGKIRWQREISVGIPGHTKHPKNSYASETPVTDGERVYVYSAHAGLFALGLDGRPAWSRPMPAREMRSGWGPGASATLHRGRLYVVSDNEDESFLAAFDARSGRELWRVVRARGSSWATPFVWEHPQRTEIVTVGLTKITSHDLEGRVLWELSGLSTLSIPTPFAAAGLLYVSSGFRIETLKPTYAIRPGASGDISLAKGETSNRFVAWSQPALASYIPTSLVYRGIHYTLYDSGFLAANDARTGAEVYGKRRITGEATGFSASPWAYNGRIFALSEDGDTFVLQAGPEYKVLGKNSLDEPTLATPAIAQGSLIIRTASKLYRIARVAAAQPDSSVPRHGA